MRILRCLAPSALALFASIALTTPTWAQSTGDLKIDVKDSSRRRGFRERQSSESRERSKSRFRYGCPGYLHAVRTPLRALSGSDFQGRILYRLGCSRPSNLNRLGVDHDDCRNAAIQRGCGEHDAAARRQSHTGRNPTAHSQTRTEHDIDASGSINLGDFLNKRFSSVSCE